MQTVAGVGGSLLRARAEGVKEIEVPLPPIEEQRRIAAILNQAEGLRLLRGRAIGRLNDVEQAVFYEMFPAELSRQPDDVLENFVEEFRYGTSNRSTNSGYPTLRIPNVVGGSLDLSDLKTVSVTDAELGRLRLQEGDVLFVRTNGNPDYVGRSAIFSPERVAETGFPADDWIYASYLIRARLDTATLSPDFLRCLLATPRGRRSLRERCKTSAGQFNINTKGLGSVPIFVPDVNRQRVFSERVRDISRETAKHEYSMGRLSSLFSSLQHRAFRGEL
jgi:type I restriction enzyme S subunit